MQRAYRLNQVEAVLLDSRLVTMGKEKRRAVRLNNQDVRLIKLTLDYINSSSGHSREGRPPSYVPPPVERDTTPYFQYGDRIKSKKYGKQRRAQSAHVSFGKYDRVVTDSDDDDSSVTTADQTEKADKPTVLKRPKSSPATRRYAYVPGRKVSGFRPAETGIVIPEDVTLSTSAKPGNTSEANNGSLLVSKRAATSALDLTEPNGDNALSEFDLKDVDKQSVTSELPPKPPTHNRPVSSILKKPQRSFVTAETPSPDASSRHQRVPSRRGSAADDTASADDRTGRLSQISLRPSISSKAGQDRRQSLLDSNHSNHGNQRHVGNGGRARKPASRGEIPEVTQAWAASPGTPQKFEEAMEFKGKLNVNRNQVIQDKLDAFKLQYPTKRY